MDIALLIARLVLVAVFILAAITKLLDRAGSQQAVVAFGVPGSLAYPLSRALPLAELTVVIALIPAALAWWGALGALLLLTLFIAGITFNLARGNTPDCHCFGQLYSEPIGMQTIVRNVVLALVAGFILVAGFGHPGPDAISWVQKLTAIERLALALGMLGILAAAAQWWALLHPPLWLVDRLPILSGATLIEKPASPAGGDPASGDIPVQPGLPVGSLAPRFRLPGLHGETLTLDSLRAGGRAVILIFVSPTCGPCNALMPDLTRWQVEYAGVLRFVLISSGSLEENRAKAREHGIVELVVQKIFEVGTVYGIGGTPGAVIIHPDGSIGSPVANGADQIRALLDQYIELLAAGAGIQLEDEGEFARAMRAAANPLDLGTPAPHLTFEDLDGGTVRLSDLLGRDTVLLFWRTTCGFCAAMEPALQSWENDRPAGSPDLLILMSEPPPEDAPLHLRSRALIDRDSRAGGLLHSTGTPTAILIDAAGNLASQPAVGADAIRPLLHLNPSIPTSEPIPLLAQAPPRSASVPGDADRPAPLAVPETPAPVPQVSLTDFTGRSTPLEYFRGRETVLLFWDAGCSFCGQMLADLRAWEECPPIDAPYLVVVVPGTSLTAQVVSFKSDVMIDRDGSVARAFGASGTPMAVRLSADGLTVSSVAAGAVEVFAMLGTTAASLETSTAQNTQVRSHVIIG